MRPLISDKAADGWAEAMAWKADCDARETLRKARFAWGNPAGRESIPMSRATKVALMAISLMLGLAMGGVL